MSDYWKARGKTYQTSNRYYQKKSTPHGVCVSSVPPPPLGKLIQSLNKDDLDKDAKDFTDKASIQDCSLVTSYNWLDKSDPTIIIPGKPPRWTPLPGETKLAQDSNDHFRDKNASKYPSHPMESTVLAALSHDPNLPADLDIVACYSSLGNLVRFVLGKDKSFRILVQVVGSTVFFVRRENSPTEKLEDIKGHGHTFPEAYTTWDVEMKGSAHSHRILKYSFGGLRMLVRAEADAYVAEKDDGAPASPLGRSRAAERKDSSASTSTTTADVADLSQLFSVLNSTSQPSAASSSPVKIHVVTTTNPNPQVVPQPQILEIKTRVLWKKDKEDTVNEEMPKLWLAQISRLVVAYHDKGVFGSAESIEVQDVRPRVERWERLARRELAAFAALLHWVLRCVRGRGDGRVELRREGMGALEVREWGDGAGEVVSEEVGGRWRDGERGRGRSVDEKGEVGAGEGGAELGVGDEEDWVEGVDGKDWTLCSGECRYCGRCKK